jgi:hypothetical protein
MRVLAATLGAVFFAAVGVVPAVAAPSRSAKLTAAEEKWVEPVLKIWNVMNASLTVVYDQATADQALIPGTKPNKTLNQTLANFVDCGTAMKAAKAPPSRRLNAFAGSMTTACATLSKGAFGVANAISSIYKKHNANLARLQLKAAFKQLSAGSKQLATARKQLLAIAGTSGSGA